MNQKKIMKLLIKKENNEYLKQHNKEEIENEENKEEIQYQFQQNQ